MSNYFWSANGNYQKKKVIEFLAPGFSATNDNGLCLDDLCITTNDIKFLKSQLDSYDIITEANKQDFLNEIESKQYLEKVFMQMKELPEDQKDEKYNKFFLHGVYDKTTAFIFTLKELYKSLDFVNLYFELENATFNTITLSKDQVLSIVETNFFEQPTRTLQFSKNVSDLTNISNKVHYFTLNDRSIIYLIKNIEGDNSNWKIFYETPETDMLLKEKFDEQYNNNFRVQLDNINSINGYAELNITSYRNLVDNLKTISIEDGKFNFKIFKDNFFIKKYNDVLALENLTLEYFNSVMVEFSSNSSRFQKVTLNDTSVGALKQKMALNDLSNIYYILDETDSYSVRLFKVQYLNNDSFKWQLLYLFNTTF